VSVFFTRPTDFVCFSFLLLPVAVLIIRIIGAAMFDSRAYTVEDDRVE
jgi:hypothetical protein